MSSVSLILQGVVNVIGTFKVYDNKENWSIIRHDVICYGKWVGLVGHMMLFIVISVKK